MPAPIAFQEELIACEDMALNCAVGPGAGPPLVVLHGGSGRWQNNLPFLEALAAEWQVFAPDLRGHGRSARAPGHYAWQDYAADIAALIERCIGRPAIVYGHSLGGHVGLLLAARRPDLVRALVVGDASPRIEWSRADMARRYRTLAFWRELASSGRPVAAIAAALREAPMHPEGAAAPLRTATVLGEESPWFMAMAENLAALDPDQLTAVMDRLAESVAGYDPQMALPAIRCPVLLLQADPARGSVLSNDDAAFALALLRRGETLRVEGVGHELQWGQPATVLNAVLPFLRAH